MVAGAGCLCGRVRIEIDGDPVRVRTCWCRECQYWGAGNGTTNAAYRLADVTVAGEVRWFAGVAASGNPVTRGFCPHCGTPLFTRGDAFPDYLSIRVGALDDPSSVAPASTIWVDSAPSWACIDPALPRSGRQP